MKNYYIVFIVLICFHLHNYAMEIILTEDKQTKENYRDLCALIRRVEEQRLVVFKGRLPFENNAKESAKIEVALKSIKAKLIKDREDTFLGSVNEI